MAGNAIFGYYYKEHYKEIKIIVILYIRLLFCMPD
jgi:hypothetical protein